MPVLLVVTLTLGGPVWGAEKRVRLRLEVPPKSSRGMQSVADRAVLEAFLASHPEIEVDPYVKLRVPGPRGEATLYMAMAGDTAPDALYVYGRSTQKYIDQQFLYPLNDYLKDCPEITGQPLFQKFLPAISRPGEDNAPVVYAITDKVFVSGLLYRKDLFAQAGLETNRAPKTWDELRDYARKLTVPEKGQFGITLPGSQGASWRFANFVWQAGGRMCRQKPDGSWYLSVDEPEAVEAFKFYRDLVWGKWERDGKVMQGCMKVESAGQEMNHFVEGRAAMTIVSTRGDVGAFLQSGLDPSQVGLAPLPEGPAGKASMLEGEFWGINRLIAHDKRRRDATWEYIKFLTSDEAKRIRTRVYVEAGWALSVNPKWLRKFGYETELRQMPPEWIKLYDEIVDHGMLEPYAPAYAQVSTDVLARMDEVLYNERGDPQKVATSIAHEANTRFFGTLREENIARHRTTGRVVFYTVMGIAAVLFGRAIYRFIRSRRADAAMRRAFLTGTETPGRRTLQKRMELLAWVFMLPAVLTIFIWAYCPLASGARLAFMDYRILGNSSFVGLDNFIEAFTQPAFYKALIQTAIYAVMSLGVGFLLPIMLALMLSEIPRFRMFYRTIYYLPAVTSGLVVMFIWKLMYDNSPQGIFNRGLTWLTGTDPGRLLLVGLFCALWGMLLAVVLGIVTRLVRQYARGSVVIALALLVLVAPFWIDLAAEFSVLAHLRETHKAPQAAAGAEPDTRPLFVRLSEHQWIARVPDLGATTALPGEEIEVPGLFDAALHALRVAARRMTHLPELMGFSMPVVFALTGVLRGGMIVLTVLAVLLLLKRRPGTHRAAATTVLVTSFVLMGAGVGLRLLALLMPLSRPYAWLQDSSGYWAMLWVILPGIWGGAGPGCIIYLAALKSIPDDLYEAADVDGAGPLEKAYHVTFQYLKPLIIINFVGAFVGTFHAMQNILVMTGGGPGDKTMTIGMDIFFNAFTHLKFGYATAEAWILGSLLIGFTLQQLRILKKLRFTRAEN